MSSLADVRKAAKKLGAVVDYNRIGDSVELAVTAPAGMRWERELHQFVDMSYLPFKPDFDDMLMRMSYGTEPCDDPQCEFCYSEEE